MARKPTYEEFEQRVKELEKDIGEIKKREKALVSEHDKLSTLYKAATAISSNLSLDEVLQAAVQQITGALGSDGCSISLWHRDQREIETLIDYSKLFPEDTEKHGKIYNLEDIPSTLHVLETGQSLLIQVDDAAADAAEVALMKEQDIFTLLMLPLETSNQVLGLLEIWEEIKTREYSPDEIRLAEILASQTAVAIENARLVEQIQSHTVELQKRVVEVEEQTTELEKVNEQLKKEIAERKQAEEALRESEEKYRTILKSIEDGYFEVDIAGNFTFFNDSLCKIFGLTEDELMGRNFRDFADEETNKKGYKTFNKVYTTGKPAKGFDWEVTRGDSTKICVEASVSLRKNPEGEPIGFQGILRDITDRKLAEKTSKKVDALEISNVVLEKFVSDALSNLMSPIYGRIQMIIEIRDNIDEIKRDLKDTETGLAKFLTGINAYREYCRLGELPMKERSSTDISHILSPLLSGQVLGTYGNNEFPIDPKVKLRFTYDPKQEGALDLNKLPYVVGPEFDITTAIQETLINAIESYDPEKDGDVVISAKKEKDNLILKIADQGRGMSPDEAEKSQLPFYKILGVKGSGRFGLGAYIARESVKYCGGDIHIESTEGVGTTASVLFKISSKPLVDM